MARPDPPRRPYRFVYDPNENTEHLLDVGFLLGDGSTGATEATAEARLDPFPSTPYAGKAYEAIRATLRTSSPRAA